MIKQYKEYDKPKKFSNNQTVALDKAYKILLENLEIFSNSNGLSALEINRIKDLIYTIYLERKTSYFLHQKLKDIFLNK